MSAPLKIGIVGGAGFTAGELIRVLVHHPGVTLSWVHSGSQAGRFLYEVHAGLLGESALRFCDGVDLEGIDVLFLCLAHGKSRAFWAEHPCPPALRVIDLSQDFRDEAEGYVYGLPEWQRERIAGTRKVANPGCFATAIQLALLPLAAEGLLSGPVHVQALTGSTGAGALPGATTHFSWRASNISSYKVLEHQHLAEIRRNLARVQGAPLPEIHFIPLRGDFTRGIFASFQLTCPRPESELRDLYASYYADAPLTLLSPGPVDLKQVVGTAKCLLALEKHGDQLVLTSVLDNLLKGASGQAVQNMNLMAGLPEDAGLRLKAIAF